MSAPVQPTPAWTGRDEARAVLAGALRAAEAAGARQAEAVLDELDEALTRFAVNRIHQSAAARRTRLVVRVLVGPKSGVAATDRLDEAGIRAVVERAIEIARLMPDDPEPLDLPGPEPEAALDGVAPRTVALSADERAEAVAAVTGPAAAAGLIAAGAYSSATLLRAVANSKGVFRWFPSTLAHFTCTVQAEDSSGWSDAFSRDAAALDPAGLGRRAIDKAVRSARPRALPAGRYTVVLEPNAVAELVSFLAYLGFGAQQVEEGQSFLVGRLGERLVDPRITLSDDAFHPLGAGTPFDWEGVPRRVVPLFEQGVARGIVHDARTAAHAGTRSTGHAPVPAPNPEGPLPYDMVLAPGDASLESMVAAVERGVLVTRFWYNRVVDPLKTVVTGMTRDGTFLIENGRVAGGIRNLRFNESVLDVLARTEQVGNDPALTVFDWSNQAVVAPSLLVRDFQFTGVTEF